MLSFVFVLALMSKRRGVSRTPATSKMKLFVTLVNGLQPLTKVLQNSMLDVAGVLETPLIANHIKVFIYQSCITCKAVSLIFCNGIGCNWSPQIIRLYVWWKRKSKITSRGWFIFQSINFSPFDYLIHLVLLILVYSFCYKYIINSRNKF